MATQTNPVFGIVSSPSASAARFLPAFPGSHGAGGTTAVAAQKVMPSAGTIQNLYIDCSGASIGSGSITWTVLKNGIAQSLTVTINAGSMTGSDTNAGHNVSYAAGDTITIKQQPNSTPSTTPNNVSYYIEEVAAGPTLAGATSTTLTYGTNATKSWPTITGFANNGGTTGLNSLGATGSQGSIVPCAGTISNLYWIMGAAPGASKSVQMILYVNGSPSLLTATVSGASATTANDTTDSISVNAGDLIYPVWVSTGAVSASKASWGMLFTPTTAGDVPFMLNDGNSGDLPNSTATTWFPGGGIVNTLAVRMGADLSAGVPFYGAQPPAADAAKIKTPLLLHYASLDMRLTDGWPPYDAALTVNHVTHTGYVYEGANHGFHNDTTPRYDEANAKLAWQRTLDFFNKYLR